MTRAEEIAMEIVKKRRTRMEEIAQEIVNNREDGEEVMSESEMVWNEIPATLDIGPPKSVLRKNNMTDVFNKTDLLGIPQPEDLYEDEEKKKKDKPKPAVREPHFVTNEFGLRYDKNDILGLPQFFHMEEF